MLHYAHGEVVIYGILLEYEEVVTSKENCAFHIRSAVLTHIIL